MSTCPLCSRDAEVRNIQGTASFGVRCALCGEFSASGEAVETARQQPALLRQLASIRRRRATENGERDEVTERWFEDPDGYGLRNEQVSVKLTRTLWLLADKSQRLGHDLRPYEVRSARFFGRAAVLRARDLVHADYPRHRNEGWLLSPDNAASTGSSP